MNFPLLNNNPELVYLDTAASSQKPQEVLDAMNDYYEGTHSNIHRSGHSLAREATRLYELSRKQVADYLNAPPKNVMFTRGTTESMNLLASTYPLTEKDTVLLTELEHHSTLVPWQQAAKKSGAKLKYIPIKNNELDLEVANKLIQEGVTIFVVAHVSNVLGSIQPIKELGKLVHEQGGDIIVDGAQAVPHLRIDVQSLGVDAYAFSGHKMYGPTGIGAVYVADDLLSKLVPYQFGGNMIAEVTLEDTTFTSPPHKFEAGTPPIAPAIGLGTAVTWLVKQSFTEENEVYAYAKKEMKTIPGLTLYAPKKSVGSLSFTIDGIDSHDIAEFLDIADIAIRSGHHCTMPLHKALGIKSSCRASTGLYNSKDDVDRLITVLKECVNTLGGKK